MKFPRHIVPLSPRAVALLRDEIGLRCAEARARLGLSQRALARALGRSPSWVREVETGQQFAPAYLIIALSRAAELPAGWFLGDGMARGLAEAVAAHVVAALDSHE